MKNKLLKSLFGLGLILSLFAITIGVDATTSCEENNCTGTAGDSVNITPTVGDVDGNVYDIEIHWQALQYNWKYNEDTSEYEWMVTQTQECNLIELESSEYYQEYWKDELEFIYTDSTCTAKIVQDITYNEAVNNEQNGSEYYSLSEPTEENMIAILNYSENVNIGATIEWNSNTNYEWTTAEFINYYDYYECAEITSNDIFLEEKENDYYIYKEATCSYDNVADDSASYGDGNTYYYDNYVWGYKTINNGELGLSERVDGYLLYDEDSCGKDDESCLERLELLKYVYLINVNLKTDSSKEIITPTKGDEIGTVTITLKDIN